MHLVRAEAHTLQAGPDGLDVLAFGQRGLGRRRVPAPRGPLVARAELGALGRRAVAVAGRGAGGRAGARPRRRRARPRSCTSTRCPASAATAPPSAASAATSAARPGRQRPGSRTCVADAGKLGAPPHCHSAEEEIFVVLEGEGTLLLGDDEHPVRPGTIVSRPAGTAVAHTFRAGPGGLVFLAYGTRVPDDICYYPRSGKMFFHGVGVVGRIEPARLLGRRGLTPRDRVDHPARGRRAGGPARADPRPRRRRARPLPARRRARSRRGGWWRCCRAGRCGCRPGGAHWYVVYEVGRPDPDTFLPTFAALGEWLDATAAAHGVAPDRVVIAGFSQGAVMSYALGLGAGRPRPAGIIALSGFVPVVPGFELDLAGRAGLPVAIGHGTLDPVIGVEFGRSARALLEDGGLAVRYQESPMPPQHRPGVPATSCAAGSPGSFPGR